MPKIKEKMLTIRLSRTGKKNKPMYRLIISEKSRDPYGRALEILGSYNPYTKDLQAKSEKIKYWLSLGAGMSATVNNLLIEKKIVEGKKIKATKIKKNKKGKKDDSAKTPIETKPKNKEEKKSETPASALPKNSGEKKTVSAPPESNSGETKKEEVKTT